MLRLLSLQIGFVLVLSACGGNVENGASRALGSTGDQDGSGTPGRVSCTTQERMDEIYRSACAGGTITFKGPTLIEMVVETSESMGDAAPNTGPFSKWDASRDILLRAIGSMGTDVSVGLLLYPNQATVPNNGGAHPLDDCLNTAAALPPATLWANRAAQYDAIASALSTTNPRGGTPTEDAYGYALRTHVVPALDSHQEAPIIILIMDGSPTIALGCSGAGQSAQPVDTQPIIQAISDAWTHDSIRTLIIGFPGSESSSSMGADPRTWMSAAARAGNVSPWLDCSDTGIPRFCHEDLSQVADLESGLKTTLESLVNAVSRVDSPSCSYEVPTTNAGNAVDPATIVVAYRQPDTSGELGMQCLVQESSSDCSEGDGWYRDGDSLLITLCPNTCAAVQQQPGAAVEVLAGCQHGPTN